MRFEVAAAFVLGALLPLLETLRRGPGYWMVDFTTMFEDYVAGGLLLIGAWTSYRLRRRGAVLLVLAWAYVTGLMSSSFWNQLEETIRQTTSEPHNALVVTVKLFLWALCVVSLVLSARRAIRLSAN